ncbi:ATP-binding cassette domain-containing protein [Thiovibrio frasassiensis]|jgi:lipooligosaccharide transport system ATP-binding protein|uniref:ATP-binding cassette domain-containing protein n=1 Tax=Thiovibrio frasassiensis TaxID=2984131 RepID=A0A9X4MGK7_9BACT|nr:ATP-binding cassette domain-containing protein [Thiovibrio frasassiensis]MDG4477104.1 ATP-binding cassette domain-containing protein [Thiovibrio frasassiensis]
MFQAISQPESIPAAPGSQTVVSVTGLTKRFGERLVVDNISFSIQRGQCVGFLGPNGAGKTTCINMLLGLVEKNGGEIRIFDLEAPRFHRQIKGRIGVVPQADSLDPDLSVEENLRIYAGYFRIPRRLACQRVDELLHFFALHNRRDEIIEHLSGGQRRRLLLARALINEPELLILDEPTIGLDPQARHLIWDRLSILQAQGTTMLLTSHYLDEVARLSQQVLILDHGQVVVQGEPQQLITDLVGVEVFEVDGTAAELDALAVSFRQCNATQERVGDKLYVYAREDCSRVEKVVGQTGSWIRRPANLEDLFIQLTGRSLRET